MSDGEQDAPPAGGALGPLGRVIQQLSSKGEGGAYQGFLSYAAEWHALMLGLGVGLAGGPGIQEALVAYAVGRGGGKRLGGSAHVRDVADEPAYALAGLAVGTSVRGGLTVPEVLL